MKVALAPILLIVGCGASSPAPAEPIAVKVAPVATAPASRAPLFVEYVVLREAWVEQVMPVDGTEEQERALRKAKAPELTSRLANELRGRLRTGAEMRPAIADSVTAVLGDLAASDERRPAPTTVERDELKATRLPDAAKTALGRFADSAKAGDIMNDPVIANGEVIVARAAVGR